MLAAVHVVKAGHMIGSWRGLSRTLGPALVGEDRLASDTEILVEADWLGSIRDVVVVSTHFKERGD